LNEDSLSHETEQLVCHHTKQHAKKKRPQGAFSFKHVQSEFQT
jgi:hypothetical protein